MSHLISDSRTLRHAKREMRGQGSAPYRGGGVGLGPMLEQDVNDVRVALLGGLVQRCVAILWAEMAPIGRGRRRLG